LTKKGTVVLSLVEQAQERPDHELREERSQELESVLSWVPWAREVEKITILGDIR
jgi:hypothetical protein